MSAFAADPGSSGSAGPLDDATAASGSAPGGPAAAGAPPLHEVELPVRDARPAAVLCVVFDEGGQAHVVLTRRSSRLRSHTGEVSFPGGRMEEGESAEAAALREAGEEVGLDPASVTIIGNLTPLSTLTSRSAITPFVAVAARRPALAANPAEVERVLTVPLAELMAPGTYHAEYWELPGRGGRAVHFFELPGDTVWGATARLLRELLDRVAPGPAT